MNQSTTSPYRAFHEELRTIFTRALAGVSIESALDRRLHFEGALLEIEPEAEAPEARRVRVDLATYTEILVVALGKAAIPMTEALLARLPAVPPVRGVCVAPALPEKTPDTRFTYFAGGHPTPNLGSFRAAEAALQLMRSATQHTFVFFLISGGGSSLFELPLDPAISLDETIAFHRALVGSGATIADMNVVRKKFSAVKGGRLAAAAPLAAKLTLQVADVPLRHLDALASAPTLPDRSTDAGCREILERYELLDAFPQAVRRHFEQMQLRQPPAREPQISTASEGRQRITDLPPVLLLSNDDLLRAGRDAAQALGFTVVVDNACDDWEYAEAARYLLERFLTLQQQYRRVCLLSGGEVTVRLDRAPGVGGRNQQFALSSAIYLDGLRNSSVSHESRSRLPIVFSAGSDGVDGNSPAAGAIADETSVLRASTLGFNARHALRMFDAYTLFQSISDLVFTGPTGTNLRDFRVLANTP